MGNGCSGRKEDVDSWRKPKETKKTKGQDKDKAASEKSPQGKGLASTAQDPDVWRKPSKEVVIETSTQPTGDSPAQRAHLATAQRAQAAEKSASSWRMEAPSQADKAPAPVPSAFEEDDLDDDLDEFGSLADAANKVWEDLMSQKHESKKDFNALFSLGELKDSVERAVKRAEYLRHKSTVAISKADATRLALEDMCTRTEGRAGRGVEGHVWKVSDLAIRRGKGLCEITTVHHEADPPFFEVRMYVSGSVVGTEAPKLISLAASDQGSLKRTLRAYEDAKKEATRAEEEANQANEELKQQHQSLTSQAEQALKTAQEAAPQTPSTSGFGGPKMAPPGLPDMNVVRKWTGAPKEIIPDLPAAPPVAAAAPASAYPDMKGVKEDLRGGGRAEASGTPSQRSGNQAPDVNPAGSAPPAAGRQAPSMPSGFPSMDELNKMDKQQKQAKTSAQPASTYPSVHPGAARESFSRPSAAPESTEGGASSSQKRTSQQQDPSSRNASKSMSSSKGGPSMPAGFPSLDPEGNAQSEPAQRYPRPETIPGPSLGRRASSSAAEAAQVQREAQAAAAAVEAARAAAAAQQAAYEQQFVREPQQSTASGSKSAPSADVWVVYHTTEGVPYYYTEKTAETVWVLPPGATARYPDGTPVAGQGGGSQQAASDDPFANLRQQEEKMKQEREYWSNWYAQYSAWYAQQAPAAGQQANGSAPSNEDRSGKRKPTASSSTGGSNAGAAGSSSGPGHNPFADEPQQGQGQAPTASAAPRGPPPPRLLAGVEDHTLYAIKSAILKEMEQMVDQAKPIAQRKKALRCLQIRWHPDKNPEKVEVANSVFQFIEESKPWFIFDPDAQD